MDGCIDEGKRLRALAEMAIIEAPVDPLLDRICALACNLLSMPMSFVTVLDETRTHVKAHKGLAYGSLPRDETFCDWTIRRDEPLIVHDLAADPRFSDHALTKEAGFRFYAGMPLSLSPGVRVGALCVADHTPRDLEAEQVECLQNLAALVLGQVRHHAIRQELARKAVELVRKQEILSQTAKLAKVGGFELDASTERVTMSDELARLYAGTGAQAIELDDFLRLFAAEGPARLRHALGHLRATGSALDIEALICGLDGRYRDVRVHAEKPMASGKIVGIVQDISDRKAALCRLEWLASHDDLTNILNRAAFTAKLEAAMRRAARTGARVALLILDVDRFKAINDTLGHDAGDAVLVGVAKRLSVAVAPRGIVARYGGDEFAVLIETIEDEGEITRLANGVLAALRQPLVFGGQALSLRASGGIALSERGSLSGHILLKNADIALYAAKRAGRDGVAVYDPAMRAEQDDKIGRPARVRRLKRAAG